MYNRVAEIHFENNRTGGPQVRENECGRERQTYTLTERKTGTVIEPDTETHRQIDRQT